MRIRITGSVKLLDEYGDPLDSPRDLARQHGVSDESEYLADYLDEPPLNELDIQGGTLLLDFCEEEKRLKVITEYVTHLPLSQNELELLTEFTRAQWADGVGAEAFYEYCNDHSVLFVLADEASRHPAAAEQIDDGSVPDFPPTSPLFNAVRNGDLDHLKRMLEEEDGDEEEGDEKEAPNFEAHDRWGNTLLARAAYEAEAELVAFLLSVGAKPDGTPPDFLDADEDVTTPLAAAVSGGSLEIATMLLEAGAQVDYCYPEFGGTSPLGCAATWGREEIAALLLERGADPNHHAERDGNTPLMLLAPRFLGIAELLLANGADLNARNNAGQTPCEVHIANLRQEFGDAGGSQIDAIEQLLPLLWTK